MCRHRVTSPTLARMAVFVAWLGIVVKGQTLTFITGKNVTTTANATAAYAATYLTSISTQVGLVRTWALSLWRWRRVRLHKRHRL